MKLVFPSSPGNQKQYHAVRWKRTGERNEGLLAVFSKELIKQKCNKCFKRSFSSPSLCRQVHVFNSPSGFSPPAGSISFQLSCVCGNSSHLGPSQMSHEYVLSIKIHQAKTSLPKEPVASVGTGSKDSWGISTQAGLWQGRSFPGKSVCVQWGWARELAAQCCSLPGHWGAEGRQWLLRAVLGAPAHSGALQACGDTALLTQLFPTWVSVLGVLAQTQPGKVSSTVRAGVSHRKRNREIKARVAFGPVA